jgi:hypothetical protein
LQRARVMPASRGLSKGRLMRCTVLGSTPNRFAILRTPSVRPGAPSERPGSSLPDLALFGDDQAACPLPAQQRLPTALGFHLRTLNVRPRDRPRGGGELHRARNLGKHQFRCPRWAHQLLHPGHPAPARTASATPPPAPSSNGRNRSLKRFTFLERPSAGFSVWPIRPRPSLGSNPPVPVRPLRLSQRPDLVHRHFVHKPDLLIVPGSGVLLPIRSSN